MTNIHCGKQTKLSKSMGSTLDTMGEIISSQCPILKVGECTLIVLNKLLFSLIWHPLSPAEEGIMQSN